MKRRALTDTLLFGKYGTPIAALICSFAIFALVSVVERVLTTKTLHPMGADELIVEPAINEGCIADECCAH